MQKGDRAERLVAEIERQQREYRRRLLRLEPGTAEWELMQVRIEGNETIKRHLVKVKGTETKIVNRVDGFNRVNGRGYENSIPAQKQKIRLASE